MNHQLHIYALDAIYKAMERPNLMPARLTLSPTTDQCASDKQAISKSCELAPINPQRTPEQREAFIRAEIVKDRERKYGP